MISIRMALIGDPVSRQIKDTQDALAKAVSAAVAGATEGVKLELRRQLDNSNGRFNRFRNAIQSSVYPRAPRASMRAAGTVYAAGEAADRAFAAFSTGAVVLPKGGKALAIPLHGYRGADGRLLPPTSSFFAGRLHFIPVQSGAKIVGIYATPATGRAGAVRKQRGTVRRRFASSKIEERWVPQFLLVRHAKLPKLLSPEAAMEKWAGQVPALIDGAMALVRS
jgi:hypothetical protein